MTYTAHPTAIVDEGATIGEDTRVWHLPRLRGARIGRRCSFGQNTMVASGVVVATTSRSRTTSRSTKARRSGRRLSRAVLRVDQRDESSLAGDPPRPVRATVIRRGRRSAPTRRSSAVHLGRYCFISAARSWPGRARLRSDGRRPGPAEGLDEPARAPADGVRGRHPALPGVGVSLPGGRAGAPEVPRSRRGGPCPRRSRSARPRTTSSRTGNKGFGAVDAAPFIGPPTGGPREDHRPCQFPCSI